MLQKLKLLAPFRFLSKLPGAPEREVRFSQAEETRAAEEREYDAITDEIHRRPAYAVRPPVLLRHVSMRFRPDLGGGRTVEHLKTRRQAIQLINDYLGTIRHEHAPPDYIGEGRHSRLFSIDIDPRVRFRVRVELHREYTSLTFICDKFDTTTEPTNDPIGHAIAILTTLRSKQIDPESSKDAVSFLYEAFWERLDEYLQTSQLRKLAPFFADFRSLSIVPTASTVARLDDRERFMPRSDVIDLRRNHEIDPQVSGFMSLQQDVVSRVLDIKRDPGDERPGQETNVVLCGMLDGAAIYCSGLGGKIAGQRAPLRYLVVYNGQTNRQLGRFLRRLNVLGELRLAALLDIHSLNEASDRLVELGARVDQISKKLQEDGTARRDELLTLFGEMTALNSSCVGGLVYRVNQSRHYAHAFQERIQDMRIVRVEGWQSYDAFVRRNLFKTFDGISRVLERYNQLGQRLERLNGFLLTQEIAANAKEVAEQTDATNKQTKELLHLQYFAEAGAAVVFMKYGGELIQKMFVPLLQEWAALWTLSVAPKLLEAKPPSTSAVAYLAATSLYAGLRLWWYARPLWRTTESKRREITNRLRRTLACSFPIFIALAGWLLFLLVFEKSH